MARELLRIRVFGKLFTVELGDGDVDQRARELRIGGPSTKPVPAAAVAPAPAPVAVAAAPAKKSGISCGGLVITSVLAVVLVFWFLLGIANDTRRSRSTLRAGVARQVEYRLSGRGSADLTYRNASGGTEQASEKLPWSLSFSAPSGAFVYLSAQASEFGAVKCVIVVDGEVVQTAEVNGSYKIATCSGSVP